MSKPGVKNAAENRKWVASGKGAYTDYPMIVLINHGSASASEIVAGGLQDHDRAYIIGQTSFGKGLVMNKIPLRDKSGKDGKYLGDLILSVAHYYTPSGRLIQRPYDKGKMKYLKEGFDEVDPNAEDSLKTDRPEFLTDLGRKVYGGGGITPDIYLVPQPKLNNLESIIRSGNLVFEFTDSYLLRNKDIPLEFGVFRKNYTISDTEIINFKNFLIEKKIPLIDSTGFMDEMKKVIDKADMPDNTLTVIKKALDDNKISLNADLFAESSDFIRSELKQEIARMVWGPDYRFMLWHDKDEELKSALTYFGEAEKLLKKRLSAN